jgi:hypothetical protein
MPATSSAVVQTLTNYARGIAQDRSSALAEFLAPTVPVASATGKFKQFNDKNAFQVVDTSRAIGGEARRLEFLASDSDYNCAPQALEIAIDDHERELAGDADPLGLERAKIDTLVTSAVISHEDRVLAKIKTAVAAVGAKGVWSSSSNDPVKELDEQIEAIAIETGMMPNRIAFGIGAWRVFRNHDKVIARQPGAALIGVTNAQAAQMLLNPGIEIRVGVLSKDSAKIGATKSATNIVGAEVFLFYSSTTPTQYDPSFAKTFRTRSGGVESVRTYRADRNRSDILAVDWSEDIQVVSTACVRRLTIS